MVGFSRLIEEDELNTLKRQKEIIKNIIEPCLGANNGKLIKTTGDGFLAIFESCDDSLTFSQEIQYQIIDQEKTIIFAKSIFIGVPASLLFFLPFFFAKTFEFNFWVTYILALLFLVIGFFLHKYLTQSF